MSGPHYNRMLVPFGGILFLSLLIVTIAAEECDQSKCKGPLKQYEILNCQPIYNNPGDCCAVAYNCTKSYDVTELSKKCYKKGREYVIGEVLRNEDRNACDEACICTAGDITSKVGKFNCRRPACYRDSIEGCVEVSDPSGCCETKYFCLHNLDRSTCIEEDGKIYNDGERFEQIRYGYKFPCQCIEGVADRKGYSLCWTPVELLKNCAFLLKSNESQADEDIVQFRCQNDKDTIIHSKDKSHESEHTCKYGNLTLHIGDELSEGKDGNGKGYGKCSCEVPPFVTCQQ